ncbi:hypothetical protein EJ04DRAFT_571654 [Polyplosphaeria fusca]|uniref:RCC1/BLIP-II protein n=1 Tax=Polyplosphaeria fusca TaxID=682080 RepID=A0A9P4V7G9_9PLEO|nr:hypothetical protein EJ04DRAFT_571654 [Polyplosphaeria fusca]
MMELYAFGFNGHGQLSPPSLSNARFSDINSTPLKIHKAADISVVWTSWCDAVIATKSTPETPAQYHGSGPLSNHEQTVPLDRNNLSSRVHFGGQFGNGLQGFIDNETTSQNITFIGDPRSPAQETIALPGPIRIQHVVVHSNESLTVIVENTTPSSADTNNHHILRFPSTPAFKSWLHSPSPEFLNNPIPNFTQVVSNATTIAALSPTGRVYTWTNDPRFPKCLGRPISPSTPSYAPHPIEYLSETTVTKLASGGYTTAALSADGSLFLWGQSAPGTPHELDVLKDEPPVRDEDLFVPDISFDLFLPPPPPSYGPWSPQSSAAWAKEVARMRYRGELPPHPQDPHPKHAPDDDADEFVKCVELGHGDELEAYHVGVGNGHVIVAARASGREAGKRSVFAMGEAQNGQLGLGQLHGARASFVPGLEAIGAFDGLKVKQIVCRGWSSWVVVEGHAASED